LQLLVFFFIAVFAFRPVKYQPSPSPDEREWPEFFHMPVLMLMLITLLNDGTLISIGYDNVRPRATPEVWNLQVVFAVGSVLAGVACVSSLLLLWWCLDSWNPTGVFQTIGIGGLSYGQVTTAIYLKVSVSDFLTLFSSRGGPDWFWQTRPANILLGAAGLSLSISTVLACAWPASYPGTCAFALVLRQATPCPCPHPLAPPRRRHLRPGPRPPHAVRVGGVHVRVPPDVVSPRVAHSRPLAPPTRPRPRPRSWIYCFVWWIVQDVAKVGVYAVLKVRRRLHGQRVAG
jgi:hypothetical protein